MRKSLNVSFFANILALLFHLVQARVDEHASQYAAQLEVLSELRSQLSHAHNIEMGHRKDLMSIEENERRNAIRLVGVRSEIARWEREHINDLPPLRIHTLRQDAESLIFSSREYTMQKHNVQSLLQMSIQASKHIRDNIPRSLQNNEMRQLMELIVKCHDQEVLNLDLERMVGHHRARQQVITSLFQFHFTIIYSAVNNQSR